MESSWMDETYHITLVFSALQPYRYEPSKT
jgi:hypothetical protein